MFHKVVWQHTRGVVGFLITTLLQHLPRNLPVNRLRLDSIVAMSWWPHFLAHPVNTLQNPIAIFWFSWFMVVLNVTAYNLTAVPSTTTVTEEY